MPALVRNDSTGQNRSLIVGGRSIERVARATLSVSIGIHPWLKFCVPLRPFEGLRGILYGFRAANGSSIC